MRPASGGSTPEFNTLRKIILERSSISIPQEDDYILEDRLRPVLEALCLRTFYELVEGLPTHSDWVDQVIDAITTNETHFFRDLTPFDGLRDQVLPALIQAKQSAQALNFLFAGCSSGQEPFSVAMIIQEHFPRLNIWNLDLLGVDISRSMIAKAVSGKFTQFEVNRGLPAGLLVKYFRKQGIHWKLVDEVKNMVRFQRGHLLNALETSPPVDLVFLRNVLIYFREEDRMAVWKAVEKVLRPEGYLILGAAETPIFQSSAFSLLSSVQAPIYQLKKK